VLFGRRRDRGVVGLWLRGKWGRSLADHFGQFVLRIGGRGVIIRAVVMDLKLQPFKLGPQLGLALVCCRQRATDVG
jgi:hypothetical protein